MGASSSGLLDEVKESHIKELADSILKKFSVFYQQQYSTAHLQHLHQEVEPKKEGRGQLLKQRPRAAAQGVLYQGSAQFSCWEEQGRKWDEGRKSKERYTVLRGDYRLEIYDSMEAFSTGGASSRCIHPAGGTLLTTEEKYRALLDQSCSGILNGSKEDSSVVPAPGGFPVYLYLPYTSHSHFLFIKEEQRQHFLSILKTCIRHQNLDPWSDSFYESQAFLRALKLYRQDKGCYESWEMLLGTDEQVLACQVMEEVLPWLQNELESKLKGKRSERRRQWMATVQATYNLALEQLSGGLEVLKGTCRQTAVESQALIRSNLDQIMASHHFLEDKIRAFICGPAEKLHSEMIAPYLSSILEVLSECVSGGIQGIRHTLQAQMDAALIHSNTGAEELQKALSTLHSTSLKPSFNMVENLTEKLRHLKQRFKFTNSQRVVQSAHMEMEQLLDSALYTLELFLQSAAVKCQPSQMTIAMDKIKQRVLKQLDHDCRVVQRRLYQESLLDITLPAITRDMNDTWKPEVQRFEEYIFSDYSSVILVQNVYDDILRDILTKEIDKAIQEYTNQKSNHLLLDSSELAISQYSLLGNTPPRSAPNSPGNRVRASLPLVASRDGISLPLVGNGGQQIMAEVECSQNDPKPCSDPSPLISSPVIVVTQQSNDSIATTTSLLVVPDGETEFGTKTPTNTAEADIPVTAITHVSVTPEVVPTVSVPATPVLDSKSLSCAGIFPSSSSTPLPAPPSTVAPSELDSGDPPSTLPQVISTEPEQLVSPATGTDAEPPVSYVTPPAVSLSGDSTPGASSAAKPASDDDKPSPPLPTSSPPLENSSPPLPTSSPPPENSSPPLPTSSPSLENSFPTLPTSSPSLENSFPTLPTSSPPLENSSPTPPASPPPPPPPTSPPTSSVTPPTSSPLPSASSPSPLSPSPLPPTSSPSPTLPTSPPTSSVTPPTSSPLPSASSPPPLSPSPLPPTSSASPSAPPPATSSVPPPASSPLPSPSATPTSSSAVSTASPPLPALSSPPASPSLSTSSAPPPATCPLPSTSSSPLCPPPSPPPTSSLPPLAASSSPTCSHPATLLSSQLDSETPPPHTDGPLRASLELLCAAVGYDSMVPPRGQRVLQQATDRAVYLSRGGQRSMEVERVKEDREGAQEIKEEVENDQEGTEGKENVKEEAEKKTGEGRKEEQEEKECIGEVGSFGAACSTSSLDDQVSSSSVSPAEDSTASTHTPDQREGNIVVDEENRDHNETGKVKGDLKENAGKPGVEEVGSQNLQPDSVAALGSLSVIRELVTEVIEVETVINPDPQGKRTA